MDMEFRVFVSNGRVTAASQYDHYAYYPHLHAMKDRLRSGIEEVWRRVHPQLRGLQQYVMDVGCIPHTAHRVGDGGKGAEGHGGGRDEWVVIEFSPFYSCTGPALFSWTKDRTLLEGTGEGGGQPFQLRLKEEK